MSYKNPSLTTDGVLIKGEEILLVKRKKEPFKGKWALPGGFVEYGETTEDCVLREVLEETGLTITITALAGVYSDPKRDPRGHTITVVYLIQCLGGTLQAGDDAADVKFFKVDRLPELSFDHKQIIEEVLQRFF